MSESLAVTASTITHDLGNVLMALKSLRMIDEEASPQLRQELLSRSIYRLEIMRLCMSVAAGRKPVVKGCISGQELCHEAEQRIALVFGDRIQVDSETESSLVFPGNAALWGQIALLVADNSIRHSGSEQPRCTQVCRHVDGDPVWCFEDNGGDHSDRRNAASRSGLGLPALRAIVEQAQGQLTVGTISKGWRIQITFATKDRAQHG